MADKNEIEFNFGDCIVLLRNAAPKSRCPPVIPAEGYRKRCFSTSTIYRWRANRIDDDGDDGSPLDPALLRFCLVGAKVIGKGRGPVSVCGMNHFKF